MMRLDEIIAVLDTAGLAPVLTPENGERFKRHIHFEIDDVPYWIEWWVNRAYLTIGARYSNYIPFIYVAPDACWPSYRTGLRFRLGDGGEFFVALKRLAWQER